MNRWPTIQGFVALTLVAGVLGGCVAGGNFRVPPERYQDALDATREVLRDYRFQIDRVDASAGVITTASKTTSGIATPWDSEQSSLGQEFEDLFNRQERRVRVTFEPESAVQEPVGDESPGEGSAADLRRTKSPLNARVEVVIDRVQRPGWRPTPKAVRSSTVTMDPELVARRMYPMYRVPQERDDEFAARIAEKIARRLREHPSEPAQNR